MAVHLLSIFRVQCGLAIGNFASIVIKNNQPLVGRVCHNDESLCYKCFEVFYGIDQFFGCHLEC